MNVTQLRPCPDKVEPFRRDRTKFVPPLSGCYALTTALGHILYVGLASSLQARVLQHLDGPKVSPTPEGRAVSFHWLEAADIEAVERGWLNMHRIETGKLPFLNKADSPVSS